MQRVILLPLLLAGCAAQLGASYSGSREPALTPPEGIREADAVPAGYEQLGSLTARCRLPRDLRVLEEEPLANVDCSEERLRRALRERAAEVGGALLVGRECKRVGREHRCAAGVARPGDDLLSQRRLDDEPRREPAPAPGPEEVARLDEPRVSRSWAILLSFESRLPLTEPARGPSELGRSGDPPPQLEELGDMKASCGRGECEPAELAHALRVAAARVGARHLAALRCFDDEDGPSCVGTLSVASRR